MSLEASFYMLLCNLSENPGNMVVPPAVIIELYKLFLKSMSHFLIELITISWMPGNSRPILSGENRISVALVFSEDTLIVLPSGRRYKLWFYILSSDCL